MALSMTLTAICGAAICAKRDQVSCGGVRHRQDSHGQNLTLASTILQVQVLGTLKFSRDSVGLDSLVDDAHSHLRRCYLRQAGPGVMRFPVGQIWHCQKSQGQILARICGAANCVERDY
jgi:hypothetical protein